jgi:hypothetical protein
VTEIEGTEETEAIAIANPVAVNNNAVVNNLKTDQMKGNGD